MKTNDQIEPTVFVIFGGAGDLAWRKLVPALAECRISRFWLSPLSIGSRPDW